IEESTEALRADEAETNAAMNTAAEELAGLGDLEARRAEADGMRAALGEARGVADERRTLHERLIREAAARRQRLADIDREFATWRRRVEDADGQLAALLERRQAAEQALERLMVRPAEIAAQRE